jgi:hypothetical protein
VSRGDLACRRFSPLSFVVQANVRDCTVPGFGGGGAQCTIMVLAALILAGNILPPSEWTSNI